MKKRMAWLFAALLLLLTGVVLRLGTVCVRSEWNADSPGAGQTVTVAVQRGTIYDRAYRPLVNAQDEYRVCVAPFADRLSELFACLTEPDRQYVAGRIQSGKAVVQTVPSLLSSAKGILQFLVKRRYGDRLLAPHLIGYIDDGQRGVTGIEAAYDERLSGAMGQLTVTYRVDGRGMPISGIAPTVNNTLSRGQAGVVLTLDAKIQRAVENIARDKLYKGAVVVMEPATGRLLSLCSQPTFQPNTVSQLLNDASAPLVNRTLSNYNCGSVFKIVSAAAALEAGVDPDTVYACQGHVTVGDTVFHCHNKLGHGSLTMKQAFAESCNCYFIQLMQEVGTTALYRMAISLDFNQAISLAEGIKTARSSLPTLAQLASPAELANLSFGQGSLLASPVHIAQMLTAVLNNGDLQKVSVLQGFMDENGVCTEQPLTPPQTAFSKETAATLREFLQYAVEEGSGKKAKPKTGGAGGKTGTAETGWVHNGQAVVQSWFAGYYPAKDPKYIVVVLSEDKNESGITAAPVFKSICDALHNLS